MAESKGAKSWQLLKQDLCKALRLKTERTLEILAENYIHYDVIFLQEVASTFVQRLKASPALATTFSVHGEMSARDQNSVVLLRKTRFGGESLTVSVGSGNRSVRLALMVNERDPGEQSENLCESRGLAAKKYS